MHGRLENITTRQYLNHLRATVPLLTPKEELALGKRMEASAYAQYLIKNADPDTTTITVKGVAYAYHEVKRIAKDGASACDHLLKANAGLVLKYAHNYPPCELPYLERFDAGLRGLAHAVRWFDYTRGRFTTIASRCIIQAIYNANVTHYSARLHVSFGQGEVMLRLANARHHLRGRHRTEPSVTDILTSLGTDLTEQEAAAYLQTHDSRGRDVPIDDMDLFKDKRSEEALHAIEGSTEASIVMHALAGVPAEFAEVFCWRMLKGMNYPDIGAIVGLSPDSVSRLFNNASHTQQLRTYVMRHYHSDEAPTTPPYDFAAAIRNRKLRLLYELPVEQQQVLGWIYGIYDGVAYSPAKTAELMGINPAIVGMLLSKARKAWVDLNPVLFGHPAHNNLPKNK